MGTGAQQASADRDAQERLKSAGEIPRHIAIIMDGNGRWAKERGMPRISGHSEGVERVRDTVQGMRTARCQVPDTVHIFNRELEKTEG